ncbi:enoyl-CoA hydratase/isomerase family protein [Chitinimonas lacunae]|uniref:Enoyl-CoA hydratase/isomerase family protein n=1 Tax=Chitinimonas lacunae TaxID=1963018 RepID=A0ABV8MU36_9NEIS
MAAIQLDRDGAVWTLTLANGENRLDDEVLTQWHAALDTVVAEPGNGALVITSADPKFWSNGIDLKFIESSGGIPFLMQEFVPRVDRLLRRLALFELPTVAALGGHTYAGGALLASACDFRVMRSDRGWFCFPEIDLKLPLTETMVEVIRLLPNPQLGWEMAMTGRPVGGDEAARLGLVDEAVAGEEVLAAALVRARELAKKDRQTYATIKRRWRRDMAALDR